MQEATSALAVQGENARHTLIVVMEDAYDEPAAHFLSKVLQAVQYELSRDVFLLRLSAGAPAVSWASLQAVHTFERVLLFGVRPGQLGLSAVLRPYAPTRWVGIQWLVADALPDIASQQRLKGALWSAMKAVFL